MLMMMMTIIVITMMMIMSTLLLDNPCGSRVSSQPSANPCGVCVHESAGHVHPVQAGADTWLPLWQGRGRCRLQWMPDQEVSHDEAYERGSARHARARERTGAHKRGSAVERTSTRVVVAKQACVGAVPQQSANEWGRSDRQMLHKERSWYSISS